MLEAVLSLCGLEVRGKWNQHSSSRLHSRSHLPPVSDLPWAPALRDSGDDSPASTKSCSLSNKTPSATAVEIGEER
jgi:hypothetical protein